MLLGDNAASTSATIADFTFQSPEPIVREPMEPSSHSSSVSANPDINFETTNRHWTVPNQQHRIVTVQQLSGSNNLSSAANQRQQAKRLPRDKPKRLNSGSYFSPQLAEQKQKEKYANQRSKSGPIKIVTATASQSPELITVTTPLTNRSSDIPPKPKSPVVPSLALSPHAILSPNPTPAPADQPRKQSSQPSSPTLGQGDAIAAQLKARQASFIRAEKRETERRSKAVEPKQMPSGALIVGPGVQGKVGNLPPSDARNGKPERKPSGSEDVADKSRDALMSFTAAKVDVYKPVRPHTGKTRRASSRSEVSDKDKAEKTDGRRPSERRQSSFGKVLERKQSETNVRKVEPPAVVKRSQSQSQVLLQPLLQPLVRPSQSKVSTSATAPSPSATPAPANTSAEPALASNNTATAAPPSGPARRFLDILPPMPMPRLMRTASKNRSWQELLQPLSGPFTPLSPSSQVHASPVEEKQTEAIPIRASSPIDVHPSNMLLQDDGPSSSSQFQDTASSTQHQESIFSTPQEEDVTASISSGDLAAGGGAVASSSPQQPLSRAEKRYQEVMRSIEEERVKQTLDEKLRREDAVRREAEKAKAKQKLQEDQQKRKEDLKWQMWEEVRARQVKDTPRRR